MSEGTHIKICIVTISLDKGGAERAAALQSQMFESLGYDVSIVILTSKIVYNYSGELFNLGLYKTEKDSLLSRHKRFKKLRKYLLENKFDFIVDNRSKTNYYRELYYSKYIYKGFNCIYVVHNSKLSGYFTNKPKKMAKIYSSNFATLAVSKHITNVLHQQYSVENCTTVYNPYNSEWNTNIKEKTRPQLESKKYILSYGRIEDKSKDLSFLINAYHHSKLYNKNVYLVIMGDGPDKQLLVDKTAKLQLKDNIIFLPFQENPFSIVKQSLFVTLTSKYEGFPMVLVESLYLGVPIVSLNFTSGPDEIIKNRENGILVSERSIPLFSEALTAMIEDKELYATCKKNAKASVKAFSMEAISKKWNSILNK